MSIVKSLIGRYLKQWVKEFDKDTVVSKLLFAKELCLNNIEIRRA